MTGLISCDNCKRGISICGITIQKFQAREYEVSFFQCPHCGEKFLVSTTDRQQRELLYRQRAQRDKLRAGRAKNFKIKTLRHYEREGKKAYQQAAQRAGELNKIGNALLKGKTLEEILREREESDCEEKNDSSNPAGISHGG